MAILKQPLFIVLILFLLLPNLQAKAQIHTIQQSNFQKFTKSASYWILQISKAPCSDCQSHEKQILNAAEILDGVCKMGKVDAKYLKGIKIQNNPTYLFLRSDQIEQNTELKENKITKQALAKFCLQQVEKSVKKRLKIPFENSQNSRQSSEKSTSKNSGLKVIDLTDQSFEKSVLQSKQAWFVEFYSPSCGHCRSLEPEYNKLPGLMGKKVNIAKIDATVNSKMAQKYQIRGYPTMLLFESDNKEKPIPYEGQRSAEQIKNWLNGKKLSKAVKQLHELTKKNYEWNCNKNIICFVFILKNKSDKSPIKYLKPLQEETVDKPIEFFYSEQIPKLEAQLMIQDRANPKMVAIWEGISSYRIYNGANTYDDLKSFIDGLMERRKWIKFERKSIDLLFETKQGQL